MNMVFRGCLVAFCLVAGLHGAQSLNDECEEDRGKTYVPLTPADALQRLKEGNQRYVANKLEHPNRNEEGRHAVFCRQHPFAVILGCSDSRVSPEIMFDQGIGDLFVVRVAGNVAGPIEIDSVEYGAQHLGASLIVVLGHERCGAIQALIKGDTRDIQAVADLMKPALSAESQPGNQWDNVAKANVRQVVKRLKESPYLSQLIAKKRLDVVGGYYRLKTGEVEILR